MAILEVENIVVKYNRDNAVVDHVNMHLNDNEIVALVGESGSGKTTLGYGIMGLLRYRKNIDLAGRIVFKGKSIEIGSPELSGLRGRHIGYIFQEPLMALNPLMTVGKQLKETLQWYKQPDPKEKALAWLERMGLVPADLYYNMFPHQLSGGMRQRIMIALALVPGPDLIIADEPTSGIDTILRQDILDLLIKTNKSILLITHDLAVAAHYASRMMVMKSGAIVESGDTETILNHPVHDYTRLLTNRYQSAIDMIKN